MRRYNTIKGKNSREIVLLKAFPCKWGKCSFCDYILDNEVNEDLIVRKNKEILRKVKGYYKVLEVINSGSCFDIPQKTLKDIKKVIKEKNIEKLFLESHYMYRNKLKEMESYFGIPIVFKCGIETFDDDFRNNVLKKGIEFSQVKEVSAYFKSVCLLVGIKGQTKDMIKRDIDILLNYFDYGCINVFVQNTTSIERDEKLISWFKEKYKYLETFKNIEILWDNTDFGVGDIE